MANRSDTCKPASIDVCPRGAPGVCVWVWSSTMPYCGDTARADDRINRMKWLRAYLGSIFRPDEHQVR